MSRRSLIINSFLLSCFLLRPTPAATEDAITNGPQKVVLPGTAFIDFALKHQRDDNGFLYTKSDNFSEKLIGGILWLSGFSSLDWLKANSSSGIRVYIESRDRLVNIRELVRVDAQCWRYTSASMQRSELTGWPKICTMTRKLIQSGNNLENIFAENGMASDFFPNLTDLQEEALKEINSSTEIKIQVWNQKKVQERLYVGVTEMCKTVEFASIAKVINFERDKFLKLVNSINVLDSAIAPIALFEAP